MSATPPPTAIDIGPLLVTLRWQDGDVQLAASLLRERCRCTDCRRLQMQGHAAAADASVSVTDALPIGSYGVQLHFSDGHDRGIYPWSYLRELASPATPGGDSTPAALTLKA